MNPLTSLLQSRIILTTALLALAVSGCSSVYHVRVESTQTPKMADKVSYFLQCADNSPINSELCEEAEVALVTDFYEIGMIQADTIDESDIVIVYGFAIEEHVEEVAHFSHSSPVIKTNIGRRAKPVSNSDGIVDRESEGYIIKGIDGPILEHAGFAKGEKELKVVAYQKSLLLRAWKTSTVLENEYTELAPIWTSKATISDGSKSLFLIIPYLSNAAVTQIDNQDADEPRFLTYRTKLPKPDPYDIVITPGGN